MNTRIRLGAFVALSLGLLSFAAAQNATGPFVATASENFATVAPNSYDSFIGFGRTATFQRLGRGGGMIVSNSRTPLPPASQPNAMYGRGVNVAIRWRSVWHSFGGSFRVPTSSANRGMQVRFYLDGVQVGRTVNADIEATRWQWRGWAMPRTSPGFNEVRIYGLPAMGYVGMDDLRVS